MRCDDLTDVLVDLVDGRLDTAQQRTAERHLDLCAACRALVTDLRAIRDAAFTLERHEPGANAWRALQARIAAEPVAQARRPASRTGWGLWLSAAAALVLVTMAGLVPLLRDKATPGRQAAASASVAVTVESVAAEFEAAERHYQKAIGDLESIARQDNGELDPQVAAVLQKNLTVIDQAINESRAALRSQPSNDNAQDGLFDALRMKVALLQQTVELINEMRQGNQAEAGRAFQTLSR